MNSNCINVVLVTFNESSIILPRCLTRVSSGHILTQRPTWRKLRRENFTIPNTEMSIEYNTTNIKKT